MAVAMNELSKMGRLTQVIGPVVDVEFPPGALPAIYTALTMSNPEFSFASRLSTPTFEFALTA